MTKITHRPDRIKKRVKRYPPVGDVADVLIKQIEHMRANGVKAEHPEYKALVKSREDVKTQYPKRAAGAVDPLLEARQHKRPKRDKPPKEKRNG